MVTFPYDAGWNPPAPRVEVTVRHPSQAGLEEPVRLLIDTGADLTVIPAVTASRLGLHPRGLVPVSGYGGVQAYLREYRADLVVPGYPPVPVLLLAGLQGLPTILGRDVLNLFRVILDGPNQTLEIP
jgi:predicted aspartyl protease